MDEYTDGSAPIGHVGFGQQNTVAKQIDCPHCSQQITLSNSNVAITTCPNCKKQIRLKYREINRMKSRANGTLGVKVALGFVVLLIIWGIELYDEYEALEALESIKRGEYTGPVNSACQQGESYDAELCLKQIQQDAIDDQTVVLIIAAFEIVAWFIVFLGLLEIIQKINRDQENER